MIVNDLHLEPVGQLAHAARVALVARIAQEHGPAFRLPEDLGERANAEALFELRGEFRC